MGSFSGSGSLRIANLDDALVSYRGTTTSAGAAGGTTLVCSALTSQPDFDGNQVVITSGSYAGQARDINGATTGGTVTPATAFGGQIISDVTFVITTNRFAHGATPIVGSTTANWNTATGASGEAGEDLVTIGANDTKYKLHSFLINISTLTSGAIVTVKLFMQVNGTERKIYSQNITRGTDPDGIWVVNGTVGIHEALRCEVYSDTSESVEIDYDYLLEAL